MRVQRTTATTGALAMTISPGIDFKVVAIKLHLSAVGGAGTFTATTDAIAGAAYDAVIALQDMTAVADYVNVFTTPIPFSKNDSVVFAWANSGNITYGLEVFWEPEFLR